MNEKDIKVSKIMEDFCKKAVDDEAVNQVITISIELKGHEALLLDTLCKIAVLDGVNENEFYSSLVRSGLKADMIHAATSGILSKLTGTTPDADKGTMH